MSTTCHPFNRTSIHPTHNRSPHPLTHGAQKAVFDGLAQEIVGACLHSLRTAAHWLAIKQGVANGQLFLIKHLILLREQTQPFDIDTSLTEISLDFSPFRGVCVCVCVSACVCVCVCVCVCM
jgi:hypothetical protein